MIELLSVLVAIAFGSAAAVQWHISQKAEDHHRQDQQKARERERDTEMTSWGGEVIDLMAEIETACAPISEETMYSEAEIEKLSHCASALVDRGRLFFPNVPNEGSGPEDEGIRVRILDQVLRACYIARHRAAGLPGEGKLLRSHMWQARRDFVTLLQQEMSQSLQVVGEDSKGDHVPPDPTKWPVPTKQPKLPDPAGSVRN